MPTIEQLSGTEFGAFAVIPEKLLNDIENLVSKIPTNTPSKSIKTPAKQCSAKNSMCTFIFFFIIFSCLFLVS